MVAGRGRVAGEPAGRARRPPAGTGDFTIPGGSCEADFPIEGGSWEADFSAHFLKRRQIAVGEVIRSDRVPERERQGPGRAAPPARPRRLRGAPRQRPEAPFGVQGATPPAGRGRVARAGSAPGRGVTEVPDEYKRWTPGAVASRLDSWERMNRWRPRPVRVAVT